MLKEYNSTTTPIKKICYLKTGDNILIKQYVCINKYVNSNMFSWPPLKPKPKPHPVLSSGSTPGDTDTHPKPGRI